MEELQTPVANDEKQTQQDLSDLNWSEIDVLDELVRDLDESMQQSAVHFAAQSLKPIGEAYGGMVERLKQELRTYLSELQSSENSQVVEKALLTAQHVETIISRFEEREIERLTEGMKAGLEEWDAAIDEYINKLPRSVERPLSEADLKKRPDDEKSLRRAKARLRFINVIRTQRKMKVPFQEVVIQFRDIRFKTSLHKTLGHFSMVHFELLSAWRTEMGRLLKSLATALERADSESRAEILENRVADFDEKAEELGQRAEAITTKMEKRLQRGMRRMTQESLDFSVRLDVKKAIKRQQKKLNPEALNLLNNRLNSFPDTWKHNQQAFHRQLLADLWLDKVALKLFKLSQGLQATVKERFIDPLQSNLENVNGGIEKVHEKVSESKVPAELPEIVLNEHLFLSHTALVNKLETGTEDAELSLPKEFELLRGEIKLTEVTFTRNLPQIKVTLGRVADYLIKTNFTEIHRAELIRVSTELSKLNSKVLNNTNLIAYAIEMAIEEQRTDDLREVIDKAKKENAEAFKNLTSISNRFIEQLTDAQNNTLSVLDIRALTSRADQLKQYVSKESRVNPLQAWFKKRRTSVKNFMHRLSRFVVRRRHEVVVAEFHKKNAALINDGERIYNFISGLRVDPEMDARLPYYYKQLFSGKHLSTAAGLRIRKNEMTLARKAVDRMKNGAGGALAIVGDALTGKTFMADYIATQVIQGKIVRVVPPQGGSHKREDLYRAIAVACGKAGTNARSVLAGLDPGTVLIFNDVEQWWLKHPDGTEALAAMGELIERYGRRHHFIITSNSYSFRLMLSVSGLNNWLVSSVIIQPATQQEMREIIWTRHETGGLVLESMGKKVEQMSGRAWDRLMNRFYRRSGGNVGLALRFWLQSIKEVDGSVIHIEDPGEISFPDIDNNNWKVLIYQLFLHRSLSLSRIQLMFADESPQWLRQHLAALKRTGLIEETGLEVFALNDLCRPYIEKWFNELRLIS